MQKKVECKRKICGPYLRLNNSGIMGEKASCRQRIQVSSNLEQAVMYNGSIRT